MYGNPRENTFAVMVVIGRKEKERFEAALPSFRPEIQQIYRDTQEGNGQITTPCMRMSNACWRSEPLEK